MAETKVIDVDRPRCRPFGLGDAMILIVALALGLANTRPVISLIVSIGVLEGAVPPGLFLFLNMVLLIFLFFLLPAFLILRLRRPRPPLRSIIGQPGFAACAAAVVLFLVSAPLALLVPAGRVQEIIPIAAVPLAWVALIATGRWAPEPSWIDRLGRVLGVMWTIALPAHLVLIRLPW